MDPAGVYSLAVNPHGAPFTHMLRGTKALRLFRIRKISIEQPLVTV